MSHVCYLFTVAMDLLCLLRLSLSVSVCLSLVLVSSVDILLPLTTGGTNDTCLVANSLPLSSPPNNPPVSAWLLPPGLLLCCWIKNKYFYIIVCPGFKLPHIIVFITYFDQKYRTASHYGYNVFHHLPFGRRYRTLYTKQ